MKNRITLAILMAALLAWSGTAFAQYSFPPSSVPAALNNGATIGETLGPETLTLTCAGVGLANPVGAWSCSGDTITRTASGSNLTLVIGPVVTVGTEYKSNVVYPTITAGTFSISVGGFAQGTVGTAATAIGYHPAGAVTAPTLTVVAASAGTITLSSLSVKAVTSEVTPASGPIVLHKTMSNTTANEVGAQITSHLNGTLAGNKTTLRIDNDAPSGTGSTTGTRYAQEWYFDGTRTSRMESAQQVWGAGAAAITTGGTIKGSSIQHASGLVAASPLNIQNQTSIDASGAVVATKISPTYNQSASTASDTDLMIARTETSLGTGAQKLISGQAGTAGTTEMFAVTNKGVMAHYVGTAIASTGTIAVPYGAFHISGTAEINTITPPICCTGTTGCDIMVIPDGAWTLTSVGGNIAAAATAVVNRIMRLFYDATTAKWYPSY